MPANLSPVALVILLSFACKGVVDAIIKPLKDWRPEMPTFWVPWLSIVFGMLLAWFSDANLLAGVVATPALGVLITGFLIGAGQDTIYQFVQLAGEVRGNVAEVRATRKASRMILQPPYPPTQS
jgi:hypothetical protein